MMALFLIPRGTANIGEIQFWLREHKIKHEPIYKVFERVSGDNPIMTGHQLHIPNEEDALAFKLRWL